jgi:putative transposase
MRTHTNRYYGHRFPPAVISHAVHLYHRFCLSFRDVEELLAERGVFVTYETVRQWCMKFGSDCARNLRRRHGRKGDIWHLDEVFVKIRGELRYLWRAVDQDGDVIDILIQQKHRNARAAKRFFRKLQKGQGSTPWQLVTDKLRSYSAAQREVLPSVAHDTGQYANNRAEVSHQPTRQRERLMRRFKSVGQTQRFLSVHGVVQNLFRLGRHLLRSTDYRLLRARSFKEWNLATVA